jgi:cathepsin L
MSSEVYQYIEKYGLEPEASYKPKDNNGCGYNASLVVTKCGGYASVTKGSESELLRICHDNGPITVTIDAGHRSFQLYKNGVYSDTLCSSVTLDHTVLLVGWGNYNGKDYWLLKNSWGPAWGMEGYFMLARNQNNMCGIATSAFYPIV